MQIFSDFSRCDSQAIYGNILPMKGALTLLLCLVPTLSLLAMTSSCGNRPEPSPQSPPALLAGCQGCHADLLDPSHAMPCTACHGGDSKATAKDMAHHGLLPRPAHPDTMGQVCIPCHAETVAKVAASLHFTLKKKINLVRHAFGAQEELTGLTAVPLVAGNSEPLALVDDLLRRRCLRCHPYAPGDDYPETRHGTGCAACHLNFTAGKLSSHALMRLPDDRQCLHCHYGNRVGGDYYGRFEQDFNAEYRTPFRTDDQHPRPYGVEFHQLAPDLHYSAGLACIDCHPGSQLMGNGVGPGCATCHNLVQARAASLANLAVRDNRIFITAKLSGREMESPLATDPAHARHGATTDCLVCHAQWSFQDQATHLLRQESTDYTPWEYLTVQGSSAVENLLTKGLANNNVTPVMADGITGAMRPGIWLKGYGQRRWEYPLVGKDAHGRLRIFRPLLDLDLSHVDEEGEVIADDVRSTAAGHGLRPYTPHTVGRAGLFFLQRLTPNLPPAAPLKP